MSFKGLRYGIEVAILFKELFDMRAPDMTFLEEIEETYRKK